MIVNSCKKKDYTKNVWKNKKNQTVLTGGNSNNEIIEKAQEDFKNKKDYVDNIIEGNFYDNINK
ncbi:hypothetical protein CLSAP_28700 [Clostridium saccharoperbutylacetonicum]|nr:hypothetical protein CLSAP_28700 [Clostridium saccharoperbutylacetonicum]